MKFTRLYFSILSTIIISTKIIAQEGWTSLSEEKYSIAYPTDWELNTSEQMNTSFILFSPLTSPEDVFRENVNLLIQDLSTYSLDFDAYIALSVKQLPSLFPQGKIHESIKVATETLLYQKIIYSGLQGETLLKFMMYCWVIDKTAYVLTLSCEASKFDSYNETGEEILNSFNLKTLP